MDLFHGEWSTILPPDAGAVASPGYAELFTDPRIAWANEVLGPFEGFDVLELGPLEGAHSYLLERLGAASVTAIEGNSRAFLKCLCMKEVMAMKRVTYKLGNFVPYLADCPRFDAIIACGVLYHMTEPLVLLERMASKADRIMLWTHYYDHEAIQARPDNNLYAKPAALKGSPYRGVKRFYPEAAMAWRGFSGGSERHAVWLEHDSLIQFFHDRGFTTSVQSDAANSNGPALSLCAKR
ncbi:class I SAM-dependent methyltransferase [Methylobacterium sp. 285MFTsu5.1]|uniref:class I SAM-dependent methyltransferase n=1 Tax=Methylobacterium sp. 285MFTsu5.1 TaxID=1172187 RepID=UPI0003794EED|nr:class I SAM-dependent methyltransferase [Methylobacterium sp. 285MFTsu5.1]